MEIKTIVFWLCIAVFAAPSFFFSYQKLIQKPDKIEQFAKWGYSKLFMTLLGGAELISTVGLFFDSTRPYAMVAWSIILLGAIGTHVRAKEKEVIAPICVLGLLMIIYFLQK